MLAGLIVFVIGKPLLKGKGESSNPARLRERVAGLPFEWLLYLFGIVLVVVCWWMVQNQDVVGWGLGVTGVALMGDVGWIAITKLDAHARDRIFRSEEHTSELQSLMRLSFAAFCLTKNSNTTT